MTGELFGHLPVLPDAHGETGIAPPQLFDHHRLRQGVDFDPSEFGRDAEVPEPDPVGLDQQFPRRAFEGRGAPFPVDVRRHEGDDLLVNEPTAYSLEVSLLLCQFAVSRFQVIPKLRRATIETGQAARAANFIRYR